MKDVLKVGAAYFAAAVGTIVGFAAGCEICNKIKDKYEIKRKNDKEA